MRYTLGATTVRWMVAVVASSGVWAGAMANDTAAVSTASAEQAPSRPEVGAQARVYRGDEGLKMTLLRIGTESDATFLVMYEGIDNSWNGKWLLSRRSHAGTGFDYVVQHNGKDYHTLVERDSLGWKRLQAYVPSGPQGSYLAYDMALSEAALPEHLLTDYLQQQHK